MDLRKTHLVSAYALWCLGTYALWLGEWEDVWPYPPVVLLLAVIAYFVTDISRKIQLSSWLSNSLGVLILARMFFDLAQNTTEALTALAHFLCYLQIAKWFREKRSFDFTLIYLMNVLQVAIGAIMAKQSNFGLVLGIYFLLAVWCAMLFFLARHHGLIDGQEARLPPTVSGALLRTTFGRSLWIWGLGLPLALAIFWLLPRASRDGELSYSRGFEQQWTGFSNVVRLDNEEQIFEDDTIAFTVSHAIDDQGNDVELPADLLWRGNVLVDYRNGEWNRARGIRSKSERARWSDMAVPGNWRIAIDRRANTGGTLFTPLGVVAANTNQAGASVLRNMLEDRIHLDDEQSTSVRYEIEIDPKLMESGRSYHEPFEAYFNRTQMKPEGLEGLRALAERLVQGVPEEDVEERIRRVFSYLTESGEFQYALSAPATTKGIDPIEDFVFNRKTGHCEYFASALALLLRYADVHSRLVTGYKGVDLNRAGRYYQVRQLFAHAWVEAHLPATNEWITLDPTPGDARNNMVEQQYSIFTIVEDVRDVLIRFWGYYIVNFSIEDQRRLLNAIGQWSAEQVGLRIVQWQTWLRETWAKQAWLLILLVTTLVGTGVMLLRWAARWGWAYWHRRQAPLLYGKGPRIAAYEEWLAFLRRQGLRRRPHQTAREFALDVGAKLHEKWNGHAWTELALAYTDLWYASRFGAQNFSPDAWNALQEKLRRYRQK